MTFIRILNKIPLEPFYVAVSGGMDSMFALHFLKQYTRNKITIAHFNHGTEWANEAESFVYKQATKYQLPIVSGKATCKHTEEAFREARYEFLHKLPGKVILAHHLNDAVETYIFNCIRNGTNYTMPYMNGNCIRPFLVSSKAAIEGYVKRNDVEYINDPSNVDIKYTRNMIRHDMMKQVLKINPGIHKMIKKKLMLDKVVDSDIM